MNWQYTTFALKRSYNANFQVHTLILWGPSRIGLYTLIFKKHTFSQMVHCSGTPLHTLSSVLCYGYEVRHLINVG